MKTRTYSELSHFLSFEDRYEYLQMAGEVGAITFGYDRWINQEFYQSREWRSIRSHVISRDLGCDLGVEGHEIHVNLLVHHMNPLTPEAIAHGDEAIIDPEFLITTSKRTHNAIHYGDARLLRKPHIPRQRGDTKLW